MINFKIVTKNKSFLFLVVFLSGMTTMAVEFAASRLLGNVFGTSNIVWASIIGLILIYLTVGYWMGGKIADRSPKMETMFTILLWAGFMVGLVPIIARPVLSFSAEAFDALRIPMLIGSFTSVLILFSIPITLLGIASPFAIRLFLKDMAEAGKIAGKISAISTMGSFNGTFLTVLVLIPLIGTYRTFMTFSILMVSTMLIGFVLIKQGRKVLIYSWMPITLIVLLVLGVKGTDKRTQGMIFETESAYNYIQVIQQGDYRYLRLNEGQGVHSIYHPEEYFYGGPWSQVLVAPYFIEEMSREDVNNIAILGLAAGTSARQADLVYPGAQVDGYEIDPKIVEAGETYFGMDLPNLTVLTEDARWGLEKSGKDYDIISIDAYRPPYIPAHLTTQEFFTIVSNHLSRDGVMVINVGRSPADRVLVDALASTINQVFEQVFIADISESFNTMIFATNNNTSSWQAFNRNREKMAQQNQADDLLVRAMNITIQGRQPGFEMRQIFTDDHAPIEWMTNMIVLDYIFSDGMETLQ